MDDSQSLVRMTIKYFMLTMMVVMIMLIMMLKKIVSPDSVRGEGSPGQASFKNDQKHRHDW